MKTLIIAASAACIALSLGGCASLASAVSPGERFVELSRPDSSYAIGQIVEIDARTKRIDMVYDPRIPSDLSTPADATYLPSSALSGMASRYSKAAREAISASGAKVGDVKVVVSLTGVVSRSIPKYSVYKYIQDQMAKNADLRKMIGDYAAVGTRFDVLSRTVTARFSLSVTDATGKGLTLDAPALERVQAALNARFSAKADGSAYESDSVMVGVYADSRMMKAFTVEEEAKATKASGAAPSTSAAAKAAN